MNRYRQTWDPYPLEFCHRQNVISEAIRQGVRVGQVKEDVIIALWLVLILASI